MSDPRLLVVGTGRLGACIGAVFSSEGFEVWAADRSFETLRRLQLPDHFTEPGLNELLTAHPFKDLSTGTTSMARECDVAFIVTPTPSGFGGRFDASMVCDAVRDVAAGFVARERDGVPLIVIVSTVMPSTCDTEVRAAIEESGLVVGENCMLAYVPAFIALGSVIHDFITADQVLIGSDDWDTFDRVRAIYERINPDTQCRQLSLVDCETAKLSINAYLSVKIGFANTVARVCEFLPGANADNVLWAVGGDPRIGGKYLTQGATAGGPCLSRDTVAFDRVGGHAAKALVHKSDEELLDWVTGIVHPIVGSMELGDGWPYEVAIFGLSYKANVPITDDSFGVRVRDKLSRKLVHPVVYDPVVCDEPIGIDEACHLAKVIIVACAHDVFRGLKALPGQTIIDLWGICVPGPNVVRSGVGPHHS